ncbi:MAG: KpsF/GutQ family sugar-phosphate isomerase [Gemmatimonadetes bacterium]|nr:KpsF/GutQ family sugar-phosphate isomerase [Gemmatimonadota bacterium]
MLEARDVKGSAASASVERGERERLLEQARRVVRTEARAVAALEERIGDAFLEAVRLMASSRGRVIVSGIGKSGIIGRKIAATLTSTGTPALFLHPVEGLHGDLGIVSREDVAILVSKSGDTDDLGGLIQYLTRVGVAIIALTGGPDSNLARQASVVLDCSVAEEACPFDLAPTSSTAAALALGDALAVALLVKKGFRLEEFAAIHPGGALGRKLSLRVRDVMVSRDYPQLGEDALMRDCVVLLAEKRGTVPIVDSQGRVTGVVTAGDLTRLMEREDDFRAVPVGQVMNRNPKTCGPDELGSSAVFRMEKFGIMAMPVVDDARRLVGIVHLHDLMRGGAV